MVKKSSPRETVINFLKISKVALEVHVILNAHCDVIQLATVLAPTAVSLEFKIPVSLIPRPRDGAGQQQESHLPGESRPHIQNHTARAATPSRI